MLKRFRKQVSKSGKLSALREKRWFVAKGEQRRIDKKKAIRRLKRKKNRVYRRY
jgi:small subunit ribosomal protein S21